MGKWITNLSAGQSLKKNKYNKLRHREYYLNKIFLNSMYRTIFVITYIIHFDMYHTSRLFEAKFI